LQENILYLYFSSNLKIDNDKQRGST